MKEIIRRNKFRINYLVLSAVLIIILSNNCLAQKDFTPNWSKGVVWYQIFPERFSNGDKTNDPKVEDQSGAYPFDDTSAFQIHPWTSDWYKLQPYEVKNGKNIWLHCAMNHHNHRLNNKNFTKI